MRTTWATRTAWATMLALLIAAVPAFGADDKVIAEFRLHGPITEAPPPEFLLFGMDSNRPTSLKDLLERVKKARQDPKVAAVILTFDEPAMGWAQMQELREAIRKLRAADKDVYCQIESASQGLYLLASAASQLSIVPTGEIGLMGLHMESAYFKKLMDHIKLEADFEHIGEYKAAAEPLTMEGPSPQAAEQLNWIADDMYRQIVDGVAEARGLSRDRVKALIDEGPFSAERALDVGLVDAVEHRQAFLRKIRAKYGEEVKITRSYGSRKGPDVDFSSPFAVFKMLGDLMKRAETGEKPAVAIVYLEGAIVEGRSQEQLFGTKMAGSTTLRTALDNARQDDSIKAVVLRIDSPGGSALASEIMWNAAKLCAGTKPLVVSMGDVAASGGYYVASAADTIFADDGTLTGSIGVVGGKLVTKGLWDWAGISFHEIKRGQNSDLYNTSRKFDDRERKIIHQQMEDIYKVFEDHVKVGRGDRLTDAIEKIARGRVYTGRLAKDKGLVDKIGGLEDAVKFAADAANLADYDLRILPRPKTFMDLFLEGLGVEDEDEARLAAAAQQWPVTSHALELLAPMIQRLDPARAAALTQFLVKLDLLGRERVLTIMPQDLILPGVGR